MTAFTLTSKQEQAQAMLRGPATHQLLEGGSRSGKTFLLLRAVAIRALKANGSRHAVLRFRFNHLRASILEDTWPKMLSLCFPQVPVDLDRSEWFATFPNKSTVWFGGLDDKERVEKVLGQEHSSIYLNECSQISWTARNMAKTRLAQKVAQTAKGAKGDLPLRMYYDANPPKKSHWLYQLFHEGREPGTTQRIGDAKNYAHMLLNPVDNADNLPEAYIRELEALPLHMRRRFLLGEYGDTNPNALFRDDDFERWRHTGGELPDMQRMVVSIDPSGSGDEDNADNDEIGIMAGGLGTDGNGYLLEDLTLRAGPATWGNVAVTALERHAGDRIVAEANYGGAMVEHVVKTAKPHVPFKLVKATRGKVVRAEPIAALVEQGRIRHVGSFDALEEELGGFSTTGYMGARSPNRGDAYVWLFTELFPGIARNYQPTPAERYDDDYAPEYDDGGFDLWKVA